MPSADESLLLFYILCAVFASVPVAMLIRRHMGKRSPQSAAMMPVYEPIVEFAASSANLMPPPVPWPAQPWTRKDALFAIILAVVVGLLMGPGVMLLLGDRADSGEEVKMKFSISLFITQIIFQAGVIGIIVGYLAAHRKFRLVPLFGLRRMSAGRTIGMAVVWLVAAYFVMLVVSPGLEPLLKQLTGMDLKPQSLVESAPQITDPLERLLMFVTLCIGAPLMEEIIFRGVLFSVAARCIHPVYASVATALLFGVIHNNLLSFIPLTLLGIFFAEAYRRTRSLAVPVLMHAMFNCVSFVVLTNGLTEIK